MDWTKLLFSFEGRVSRSVFWYFVLACMGIGIAAGVLMVMTMGPVQYPAQVQMPGWILLLQLAMVWPALAIYAKRWHDQDKSGWWTLVILIPIVGGLIALIMLGFIQGTAGPNRFGEASMS